MNSTSYGTYYARCWAEERSAEEITTEVAWMEARSRRTYLWNEVGNVSITYAWIDELKRILSERA